MIRLLLCIFLSILGGCERSNYGVRLGASDYFLENRDRSHVYIVHVKDGRLTVAVDQMVVDYRIDGKYLFVLQKVASSYECKTPRGKSVLVTIYTDRDAYWIIDLNTGHEIGPYDGSAFFKHVKTISRDVPALSAPQNYFTNEGALPSLGSSCVVVGQESSKT